jgi:hypothetical protein
MSISFSNHAISRLKTRFSGKIKSVLAAFEKELQSFWALGRNGNFVVPVNLNGKRVEFVVAEKEFGQQIHIITVFYRTF